ncbi:RagB/SusD family nutrient uptake outer membrane protein [Flavitalea sp. BT771]|uniref:RagB/SusD family nutrient uptake outer membrane protein n=1 Tax=Flavitalea sp. BT771 TaxID=3063329 RepID=UPI0026E1440E|nr:RagB/SusD family nutrient uptake outer membrane protein [Flavitalea sp. BT771]MDO6430318.1 RagB/SusD family nutrient uptake outer membrane protein [Flavitalea sp. BT771]MDV6219542.1 RagB/SusD family nutrient uptake outer membrane protein [Flavitalea sp. BT771]
MRRNIIIIISGVIIGTAAVIACNKRLNVFDQNNPTIDSYFKTAGELRNGVNAAYSTLRSANLVGREWFFTHDMRGGETWAGGSQLEAPRAELLKQAAPAPSNSVMTSVWTGSYQIINRTNVVITKGTDVKDDPAARDVIIGEAKFLRAWAYFELVTMWGDVPIYTEPVTTATGYKGKSPAADVYTLIISDLTDAVAKLPDIHSKDGRATKDAANFLLGKVLMQKGDYAGAKTALMQLYNKYQLTDNYLDNFDGDVKAGDALKSSGHEFNPESILEVVFVDKGDNNFNWGYNGEGATADGSIMRSQEYGKVWGNVIPSDAILDEFEAGDPRYKFTFYESGDKILTFNGTDPGLALTDDKLNVATSKHNGVAMKRIYRKYSILDWNNDDFHPDGLNQRIMRYAEALLMLAECEAEVGTPAAAAGFINEVRDRASVHMPHVTLANHDDAIKAVMHEKAVEMAGEEVNNIDMLRWRGKGYYPSMRPDPKPGQVALFPIPASETSANPMIK